MVTACKNEDNSIIVCLLNQSDQDIPYSIELKGKNLNSTIKASALQTVIFY
jgi:hypothetical protein